MRAAGVQVPRVVEGLLAPAGGRIRGAYGELAARRPGKAIRSGIRTEIVIERPVLLHDHDHVLDLVDARGRLGLRTRGTRDACAGRTQRDPERRGGRDGDDSQGEERSAHRLPTAF
jgi:hypothetical protein